MERVKKIATQRLFKVLSNQSSLVYGHTEKLKCFGRVLLKAQQSSLGPWCGKANPNGDREGPLQMVTNSRNSSEDSFCAVTSDSTLGCGRMCENPVPAAGKENWRGRRTYFCMPEILLVGATGQRLLLFWPTSFHCFPVSWWGLKMHLLQ